MIKMLTGTEALVIDQALKEAYKLLVDCGYDDDDLQDIKDARVILKGLKETSIEKYLGEV